MSDKWEKALTTILTIAAVAIAGALIHREVTNAQGLGGGPVRSTEPELLKDWNEILQAGIPLQSNDAPIKMVEFFDFECPFCRVFDETMRKFQEKNPGKIARLLVHFPLTSHRFAIPAAKAAECAGEQGRFIEMHEGLLAKQDSFGLKTWTSYALEASIRDSTAFQDCIGRAKPFPRIETGKTLSKRRSIQATPTVIINGWRMGVPPTAEELPLIIENVQAGKPPVTR